MVAPSILMAAICKHLSENKDLQNQLRNDESLIPAAIEEFVRMYTPYRGFARTAVHPVTISGQDVPAEEPITLTYAAANRDPDQFVNPGQFVLNRENITSHVGFGRGKHRCAGMSLARMMMKIFLKVLLRNTTDFDIDGELEFARLPEIGMISCPLNLKPATP
jgi:cytochrome P450